MPKTSLGLTCCIVLSALVLGLSGCTPKNLISYQLRGFDYAEKGDHDRAIIEFTRAIELDRENPAAYYNRGNSYREKGDHDRAIADYTRAIELWPYDTNAYRYRAEVYAAKGNDAKAAADRAECKRLTEELKKASEAKGKDNTESSLEFEVLYDIFGNAHLTDTK